MDEYDVDTEKLYESCADDFALFMRNIIGLKNEPFHDELDDALANPIHKKIVITFPRGHGKSTHISAAYPLWRIAKDHSLRILLISASGGVSKSFLSETIGHIERNEEYQQFARTVDLAHRGVVPKMKNYAKMKENWSGDSIVIERENLNLKDPTINAIGLFGSILSKRADIIICDDIVNQENSATEDQRNKVIDWIYTTIMPVLVPGGTFIYLGNTWHQDDLVARLLKDPQFDYKKKKKAIITDSNHPELWEEWAKVRLDEALPLEERLRLSEEYYQANKVAMDDGVEVMWPSRYLYKDLYLTRLSNPYAFARMYQCDPSDRPDQKFKDEWIDRACKKGEKLRLQYDKRTGFETDITTEGVDLAISEKTHSDDTVLLTIDRVRFSSNPEIHTGDIILRNIRRGKMSPNAVKDAIKEDYEKMQPDGIRVETVGYQEAIQRDLDDMGVPVRGYKTGGEKKDPYIGINSLAIYFELGKVILPFDNSDPHTIMLVSQLINEMRAFPDGHTGDALMAFWFAFSEMRDLMGGRLVVPSTTASHITKESPDISNPEVLKVEEKKADQALILEQQHEMREFARMMRGR